MSGKCFTLSASKHRLLMSTPPVFPPRMDGPLTPQLPNPGFSSLFLISHIPSSMVWLIFPPKHNMGLFLLAFSNAGPWATVALAHGLLHPLPDSSWGGSPLQGASPCPCFSPALPPGPQGLAGSGPGSPSNHCPPALGPPASLTLCQFLECASSLLTLESSCTLSSLPGNFSSLLPSFNYCLAFRVQHKHHFVKEMPFPTEKSPHQTHLWCPNLLLGRPHYNCN